MGPSWGQSEGQESSFPQVEAGLPWVGMGELFPPRRRTGPFAARLRLSNSPAFPPV